MDFSVGHLREYLGERLGTPVEVLDVERFGRGVSRMTWFVTCRPAGGEEERLVFRLDPPAGSVEPTPLDQEYFLYERLGQTEVPVAEALWWEDAGRWTERPFYVRRAVEGSWNVPDFLTDDPRFDDWRISISKEHMRAHYQTLINSALHEYIEQRRQPLEETLRRVLREELKRAS